MKASEVIKELQKLIETKGDRPVALEDHWGRYIDSWTDIEDIKLHSDGYRFIIE